MISMISISVCSSGIGIGIGIAMALEISCRLSSCGCSNQCGPLRLPEVLLYNTHIYIYDVLRSTTQHNAAQRSATQHNAPSRSAQPAPPTHAAPPPPALPLHCAQAQAQAQSQTSSIMHRGASSSSHYYVGSSHAIRQARGRLQPMRAGCSIPCGPAKATQTIPDNATNDNKNHRCSDHRSSSAAA